MNVIHRSIWNDKAGTFVAASELAKGDGKTNSLPTRAKGALAHFILEVLLVTLMLPFAPHAHALPAGGVLAAGGASISSVPGSTTITQSSRNVVINWQSFSIGQGEAVRFLQPDGNAVALNRVLGSDPSSILGSLSANGKVFLINPNGILFGSGAQVNVGGLVASTLNISDSDFMNGRYQFAGSSAAAVVNQGSINAEGGYVALLGAHVGNDGVIQARLGTVVLAAGNAITLDVAGDGLLNVTVNQGAVNALVENGGMIQADGGRVLLTAKSAGNLLASAVNTTGIIQAQSIGNRNGTISLLGDRQGGTVNVGGTLDVSGIGAGKVGGGVTATGHHVGLFDAHIIATGDAGGGTVLIGGDYQGRNPAIPNAAATTMSAGSTIAADAITLGSGGRIVLWADDSTRAHGSLSARGGAQGGDGGLIETSGHWLDVTGINVSASAAKGRAGSWLLDPNNIIIQAAGPAANITAGPNFTSTNDSAIVTTASIEAALNAGTSVIVTTGAGGANSQAGNISVSDTLTWTHVAGPTLTLNATNNVIVNVGAAITATTGSLVLNAGNDVTVNAATKTTTGNLSFAAGHDVNLNAATTISTGTLSAIAGHDVRVNAAISVTTGNVVLRADNDGSGPGAVIGGTVAITCAANCITITAGQLNIRFNPADYSTTNAERTAYGLKLTGGGALDAKAWVFGNALDKVYAGTTAASVNAFKPDITAALPPVALGAVANANFDTKDVGANKLVTFDSAFADAVFALYATAETPAGHGTARANVTPAPLTVKASDVTKTYGATPVLSLFSATGLVNGETVGSVSETSAGQVATASVAGGPYAITPSAATGGTFTPSNYTLSYAPGALSVTPLALLGSITAADKTYDSTSAATITGRTLSGVLGADVVSYSGGTATFDTPVIGVGKAVTGSGLGLSGADSGNYTVNPIAMTTATITPVVVPPLVVLPLIVLPIEPPAAAPAPGATTAIELTRSAMPGYAAEEMMGGEEGIIPAPSLAVAPTLMPRLVRASLPAQLMSVAPVVKPAVEPVDKQAVTRVPMLVPLDDLPQFDTPSPRPRKQDRN